MNIFKYLYYPYQWNKSRFWFLLSLNILAGTLLQYIDTSWKIEIAGSLFFYNIKKIMDAQRDAKAAKDGNDFSWKFLQSLPISRKMLIQYYIGLFFINLFPLFVFIFFFMENVNNFELSFLFGSKLHITSLILAFGIFFTIDIIQSHIETPRLNNIKSTANATILLMLKSWAFLACIIATLWYGIFLAERFFFVSIIAFFKEDLGSLLYLFKQPWLTLPIVAFILHIKFRTVLRIWQEESLSYKKVVWDKKKDSLILVGMISYLVLPWKLYDYTPRMYTGDPILKYIYENNLESVQKYSLKSNLNKPNDYGFTPILTAVHSGHLSIYNYLENLKASHEGTVHIPKDERHSGMDIFLLAIDGKNPEIVRILLEKGYDPNTINKDQNYSALHLAASDCSPEIVDLLIEKGARVNVYNVDGRTPLHMAAEKNCVGVLAALIDAGVDTMVVDKDGKLARDLVKVHTQDLAYYLQKKMRKPAGK